MLVRPLELLSLPEHLNGSVSTNRMPRERADLGLLLPYGHISNDLEAISQWLDTYAINESTFKNYRREAERLLMWAVIELQKPVSSLVSDDLRCFSAFLLDPQPASRWISADGKHSRTDPRWRPFCGPLSASSVRLAIVTLGSMFRWLVDIRYLRSDPTDRLASTLRTPVRNTVDYFSQDLLQELRNFIVQLPQDSHQQRAYYRRCRWLTTLFYAQGMRLSEVADGNMGQFFCRVGEDGVSRWWLRVRTKEGRGRVVPAIPELIEELSSYRKANGLSSLPTESDETPLVIPFRGVARRMDRKTLHNAVKGIFINAASWLRSRGCNFSQYADQLEHASARWLRHTTGSHMIDNGVSLGVVRDHLGHASLATTFYLYVYPKDPHLDVSDDYRYHDTVTAQNSMWRVREPDEKRRK
ncbi:Tyrosine recombinase XerC [Paraburkholderia nemoris]|uniref:Tyrosine recombinase XerC n=1 Tax=Paraburkholderia nemoris TaxID=2793076 RepID=A0ABM8T861_9BURK|nr:Tyrosine recombinase XerC [Paraburkholderia nemoris]